MLPPVKIPWPLSSAPGARPQESAGRLIGCYAEPLQQESGPAQVTWRRSPGLSRFAVNARNTFRGSLLVNNLLYYAMQDRLLTSDANGTVADVGLLSGVDVVTMARNNAVPNPNVAIVTALGAFVSTGGAAPIAWPDADLPQPNAVAFQDGYFHFTIGDRRVFATEVNSTNVNALTFTTMQSRADDILLRPIPYKGLMFYFATAHCEVFQNGGASIAPPAFPYARIAVIDRGLLGANAIAGHELGFGQMHWVADDFGVYRLNGLQPEKVSPPDLDRAIRSVPDKSTLRASCYVHAGHSFWVISSPTFTWEFNLNTQKWNEKWDVAGSGLITQRWRANGGTFAFGKWIMGSSTTNNLVYVDDTVYKEEGDPMLFRMESGLVKNFPSRTRVGRADFNMVLSQGIPGGSPTEQKPVGNFSYSDDGGVYWKNPSIRSLGELNSGVRRVSLTNCGSTGAIGRRWRIDVYDGVYVALLEATQSTQMRAP